MAQDHSLRGVRILIAEDNALQAFDLMTLLRDAGAEIVGPARTVAEVLALGVEASPSCAVLDVILRGETVWPAAKALRERGIALVFCTGSAGLEGLRADWPETPVLSKPVPAELLLRAMSAVCGGTGAVRVQI